MLTWKQKLYQNSRSITCSNVLELFILSIAICKGKQLKTRRNTLFMLENNTHKSKYFKISLVFSRKNYTLVGVSKTL